MTIVYNERDVDIYRCFGSRKGKKEMRISSDYYVYPNAGWWHRVEESAKKLSNAELWYARRDCHEAAKANPETEGKYMDELSIYVTEINRRSRPDDYRIRRK